MFGMKRILVRSLSAVCQGTFMVAEVGILLLMGLIFVHVFLRYIFYRPWYGTEEVSEKLLILITFFAVAEILRRGQQIDIGLIRDQLPKKVQRGLYIFVSIIGLGLCSILSWQGWETVNLAYTLRMKVPSLLATPLFISYSFVLVGMVLLSLQFLVMLIEKILPSGEGKTKGGIAK